jgi:hypothetical protein
VKLTWIFISLAKIKLGTSGNVQSVQLRSEQSSESIRITDY